MPELDEELVARAVRWCADAGRQASPAQVRAALGRLSWDELLSARALLADPPPARPLGPFALADMARGAMADVAAERERRGQYQADEERAETPPLPAGAAVQPPPKPRRGRPGRRGEGVRPAGPLIRRARDRVEPPRPVEPQRPLVDELYESEGRPILERLIREVGARRALLVQALASRWRRADGAAPSDEDLSRLLETHGMRRGFERRERDALLHELRAAGGSAQHAAARAGLDPQAYRAALDRLGATADAEAIRDVHRDDLRRRATLAERARLVLAEAERLTDLGLLREVEEDLRTRLPEHVRAIRHSGGPVVPALARSLGVAIRDVTALAATLGIGQILGGETGAPRDPAARGSRTATGPERTPRRGGAARRPARQAPARGSGLRPPPRRPRGGATRRGPGRR